MKQHRIVLAGCGSMANAWLDEIEKRKDAEIIALVDVRREAVLEMAKRRTLSIPCFESLEEALAATNANLVVDVTIPAAHKQVVTTALQSGCSVLGEKPIAQTLEDAEEVVQLSQRTGHWYAVMQNRRYTKLIRTLRQLLADGKIGTISSIHADFFLAPHFGGFREQMDSPLIVDMAIHTFDQARFLTGANAVSVFCHEYNPPGSWYEGNAAALCFFEMSDGSVFSYRGSWCADGKPTSWDGEWRITGTQGSAEWDGESAPRLYIKKEPSEEAFIYPYQTEIAVNSWTGREGHAGCLDEMFAALEENRPAETDCHDNMESMKMVFGALESAASGKKIIL
ncbi:Gfo/Idh/MocA family protein [Domibacillus robiginosus]|uniref:Gfo/Idh/MocA family protein n=1 Tax=Domibacillus robiginosus TaxID=1071054 RepID=UPI00067E3C85|nr:Gfo/Idh/MocA family oxidoreductase [Domibacillus robiginosus]